MWDADWLQLHVPTLILPETLLESVQNGILEGSSTSSTL